MNKNPFIGFVVASECVGSRVTCDPPPTDTDQDVLILTTNLDRLVANCVEEGFTTHKDTGEGSMPPEEYKSKLFCSMRKGEVNLLITEDKEFYDKFLLATHVCKTLNVLDKQHRIVVFQAILYGNKA